MSFSCDDVLISAFSVSVWRCLYLVYDACRNGGVAYDDVTITILKIFSFPLCRNSSVAYDRYSLQVASYAVPYVVKGN